MRGTERRRRAGRLWLAVLCLAMTAGSPQAETLHGLAAGSLREVLGKIGDRYRQTTGIETVADFGPSGVLRESIEKGRRADFFASADMGHPLALLQAGLATRVVMFARNQLCGIALPRIGLTTASFIDRLLDPTVKLGTATPKADPAGDYTWRMFRRIDALRPGSFAILDKKAQQIFGGPTNNAAVGGKDPAVAALASGRVDVVIGYCTSARLRLSQMPELQVAAVPRAIAAGAEYGLAILRGADPRTADLALFILSPAGQQIFADYGFAPVTLPAAAD
jgi:molybdate transport system substrate-binding protein